MNNSLFLVGFIIVFIVICFLALVIEKSKKR